MLDQLRRQKITLLFLIFDADQNGYVERQDFERAAKTLAVLNGVSQFSDDYRRLHDSYSDIYRSIKTMMDTDGDHRVGLDEWITYFEGMLEDEDRYLEVAAPIARYIFNMLDHNENGKISIEEWRLFSQAYNIPAEDVDDIFNKMDADDSGFITREEFGHLVTDFFLSDDPDKPGNYIFGRF